MALTNWAGNYTFTARRVHRPSTLEELAEIASSAPQLRVIGSRHSFSALSDAPAVVSLERMPVEVSVDREGRTVSLAGQINYGQLADALDAHGMALANLASLPHICVAGAVATATHGSGDANANLASAVAGLEIVTSGGEVLTAVRGDRDFNGMVVALGALGIVTRLTLDIEPAYEVRQRVFEDLSWDALLEHFDQITSSGYSVSLFTVWTEPFNRVWIKTRVSESAEQIRDELFGARPATVDQHVIAGHDPINCTPQLGSPGLWSERLPHFRMGFTPSSGEEIQSEYLVPRRHAVAALEAVRGLAEVIRPLLHVTEIRTVAADELWLSPQYREDTVGIHFTWRRDQEAVERTLVAVESALSPFEFRPHWGKFFLAQADVLAARYPRLGDFSELMGRVDRRGAFTNEWLRTHLLPAAPDR
jgi:xylitol oxidase